MLDQLYQIPIQLKPNNQHMNEYFKPVRGGKKVGFERKRSVYTLANRENFEASKNITRKSISYNSSKQLNIGQHGRQQERRRIRSSLLERKVDNVYSSPLRKKNSIKLSHLSVNSDDNGGFEEAMDTNEIDTNNLQLTLSVPTEKGEKGDNKFNFQHPKNENENTKNSSRSRFEAQDLELKDITLVIPPKPHNIAIGEEKQEKQIPNSPRKVVRPFAKKKENTDNESVIKRLIPSMENIPLELEKIRKKTKKNRDSARQQRDNPTIRRETNLAYHQFNFHPKDLIVSSAYPFSRLVCYKGPIGKKSYDTINIHGVYNSYWMECIDKLLEDTENIFECKEPGYFCTFPELRSATPSHMFTTKSFREKFRGRKSEMFVHMLSTGVKKHATDLRYESQEIGCSDGKYEARRAHSMAVKTVFEDEEFSELVGWVEVNNQKIEQELRRTRLNESATMDIDQDWQFDNFEKQMKDLDTIQEKQDGGKDKPFKLSSIDEIVVTTEKGTMKTVS